MQKCLDWHDNKWLAIKDEAEAKMKEIANVLNPILLEVQLRRDWDLDIGVELFTELVLLVEKLKDEPEDDTAAKIEAAVHETLDWHALNQRAAKDEVETWQHKN